MKCSTVGLEFWKKLCNDHGITPDGSVSELIENKAELKETFFYEVFVYLSVLVISKMR